MDGNTFNKKFTRDSRPARVGARARDNKTHVGSRGRDSNGDPEIAPLLDRVPAGGRERERIGGRGRACRADERLDSPF